MSFNRGAAGIGMALVVMLSACADNVGIAIVRRAGADGGNQTPSGDLGAPLDVGPPLDASPPLDEDGPPFVATCANVGIASIRDDFQGRTELGPRWTATPDGASVTLLDGQLVLQLAAGAVSRTTVTSTDRRSLRSCAAHVALVRTPTDDPAITTGFLVSHDDSNYLEMKVVNQEITFQAIVDGRALAFTRRPHNPVAFRWLRFRDDQVYTYYEVSPDGQAWTVIMGHGTQPFTDDLSIKMYLASSSAAPGQAVAGFDNMNVLP